MGIEVVPAYIRLFPSGSSTTVDIADLRSYHVGERHIGGEFAGQLSDRGQILFGNTLERADTSSGTVAPASLIRNHTRGSVPTSAPSSTTSMNRSSATPPAIASDAASRATAHDE